MFMFAAPQFSSNHNKDIVQKLQQVLAEQRGTLATLCAIVEYLKGYILIGLESSDVIKYNQKIQMMTDKQVSRYNTIDDLINTNIFQMKKEKTTDNTALVCGKEIRKIESGIRTLKLFVGDAINMSDPNQQLMNRSEERLRYFDKRAIAIEVEINTLSKRLSAI